ncbi:tripartite tricarboxylate transporter substrate binding protein [Polaromonas sp.]|uniref:Bug family tripartite tricarboxylate transporter substrate binding protein n=1 Tax=Polaromonas sp. TaxID=1869339 RepID=UPI003262ED2C
MNLINLLRRTLVCTCVALTALHATPTLAQSTFPNKPVRLVVPFATGGASDTFARLVGQVLSERLGQPFVVENRTGAGGTVGANLVAKAPADGYTLFVGDIGTHGIASSLYTKLGYDPIKDFVPISYSVSSPLVLVVTPSLQAKDVRSFIADARARPGKLDYASSGRGGISHLAVEMLKAQTGIYMVHVPYKGGAPALTDLMGGQVQMMMPSVSTSLQHIRSGRLRALGVASTKRSSVLPDIPTLRESGLPDYVVEPWIGIMAPAGTSKAVTDLLQREFSAVLALPAVREKLMVQGFEVVGGNGDELARVIKNDVARWATIVKQSGAQVE